MAGGKSTSESNSEAANNLATAWEKAEKAIAKNKPDQALTILREADAKGLEAKTLHLAGHATWLKAKSSGSVKEYRSAAGLLRDSVKMNPRDKKSNSVYNDLKNEMLTKRISESALPKLISNGAPTLSGIVVIMVGFVTLLGTIFVANNMGAETTDIVELQMTWSENGVEKSGIIVFELYPDKAPVHVENFKEIVV